MNNTYIPIQIFDTTLRDGLQASRRKVSVGERLEIADRLARMGVNTIEAGFANSNDEDSEAIRLIAKNVGTSHGPTICSLARLHPTDIREGIEAIQDASHRRLHTFIGTSDIHMQYKHRKSPEEILTSIGEYVAMAARSGKVQEVQFSLEDFSRTREEFAVQASITACKAGAGIINFPDTVGYALPDEFFLKINRVINEVKKQSHSPVFSVHNHDDLGFANANTYMGVKAGARQVEVTVNGVGERAGNSAMEEIIAAFSVRNINDGSGNRLGFDVDRSQIGPLSELISKSFGIKVPANKAVVGANAFAHGSGIHQDGMSKNGMTYEILDGTEYGVTGSHFYLSPHSGKAGIMQRANQIGLEISDSEGTTISKTFSNSIERLYADDADIVRAVFQVQVPEYYRAIEFHPIIGLDNTYKMVMKLSIDGKEVEKVSTGNGLIDAAANAIRQAIRKPEYLVKHYNVESQAKRTDADALAQMVVEMNGYEVCGLATNRDVLSASIYSFIDGANRMRFMEERLSR